MTYNLNNGLRRMEKLQYQTATGKKFRVPSDDPISASKSLKFNTDMSKINQYQRNAKDAESWMKETEGALKEINAVLHRANELTVQAANGTNAPDDLLKIKEEIKELKGHLIQIGNTTYAGRSIFTGYKTDEKLLDDEGNYNVDIKKTYVDEDGKSVNKDGYLIDVAGKLIDEDGEVIPDGGDPVEGNGGPIEQKEIFVYNVGVAETVEVNTLGNRVFGNATDSKEGRYTADIEKLKKNADGTVITTNHTPYLIHMFNELETALEKSDQAGIQSSLSNIKDSMGQILSVTAEIGAKTNRLELTTNKLADQALNLEELLSFNEDVSLPEAYMKLSIEENVYRASLAVGAKVIQPSLMDFLR